MNDLRTAAQQALEALKMMRDTYEEYACPACDHADAAIYALRAALAEYDKNRVKVDEMKANWALQRKLAQETEERDRQQREYEEQRLAALADGDKVAPGEPVAHLWQHSETGRTRVVMPDQVITADATWFVVGPLYLAPPQRKPLTYEQLAKLGKDTVCLWDPPKWGMSELWEASLVEFGRAVEKAHGIDAPPLGSDGCDHCRHPLYAAIKCSHCGRVTE